MAFSRQAGPAGDIETSRAEDDMGPATSSEIEFAVGILASRHYVSPEQAYNCLRIARCRADRNARGLAQSAAPADVR